MNRVISWSKKLLLLAAFCSAGLILATADTASASHTRPPAGVLPAYLAPSFPSCGHTGESPCLWQWVAARGNSTQTVINVPYGTASIPLDFHFGGLVSIANEGGADDVRLNVRNFFTQSPPTPVTAMPGSISWPVANRLLQLRWANGTHETVGQWRHDFVTFTYAPTGGFRTSGTYRIRVDGRVINHFNAGGFSCVGTPGFPVSGWGDFGLCPATIPFFEIQVNITGAPTPTTLSCGNTTPTTVTPGEVFTLRNSFSSSGGTGPPVTYTIWVWWDDPGAAWPAGQANERLGAFGSTTPRGSSGSGILPNAIHPQTLSIANPGRYDGRFRVQASDSTNSPITCNFTITVAVQPYHQIYGDTRAGSGFMNGATCPAVPGARIIGWNRDGSPDYTGAGSQLAAYAFDTINFFASGQLRPGITTNPKPLSFANVNPSRSNIGASPYGGGLMDGQAVCAPNHYDDGVANATTPLGGSTPANIAANVYQRGSQAAPANLTITGGNLGLGTGSRIIYVYGDVTITGNITYAGGNYNDVDQIPGFRLVVRGNIYVEPGVTQLDGIYIAQPRPDGTRGRFYTCAPGGAPPDLAEMEGVCRTNKLTIYGAVLADLIKLTRSRGDINQATNTALAPSQDAAGSNAAEVIIMTPEAWLVSDFAGNAEFDAVNTLPPVL